MRTGGGPDALNRHPASVAVSTAGTSRAGRSAKLRVDRRTSNGLAHLLRQRLARCGSGQKGPAHCLTLSIVLLEHSDARLYIITWTAFALQ